MLRIENELGVKATYNVVGSFMNEVRATIEADGHCIAFHSYDHKINTDQLPNCREVDYRIKGYRATQSKITAELTDENLCFHNFEWLAQLCVFAGVRVLPSWKIASLKFRSDLMISTSTKESWILKGGADQAITILKESDFVAFCLHDCYGSFWLPRYEDFLGQILQFGNLKTLNEVSNQVILAHSA